jgi:hypothetical protein
MAKVDKTQYTKSQWAVIKEQRRQDKLAKVTPPIQQPVLATPPVRIINSDPNFITSFVIGNGTSRASINLNLLKGYGKIYGCNALYRTFASDYLIAVDIKMVLEITKSGYQHQHQVWTNPNKAYQKITGLNYFSPSKGWSSGPTALWLASQHKPNKVFILGFDYQGLNGGKNVNNIYVDTENYKKSTDGATYYGNWLKQTSSILKDNPGIEFVRVIAPDNYCPPELNNFNNLKTVFVDDFKKTFNL